MHLKILNHLRQIVIEKNRYFLRMENIINCPSAEGIEWKSGQFEAALITPEQSTVHAMEVALVSGRIWNYFEDLISKLLAVSLEQGRKRVALHFFL